MGVAVEKSKVTYIHIYCFSLIAIPFFVGILEYIVICSGQNCTIDGYRLWRWLLSIILFFIPITLCIWSEFFNGFIRGIFHKIQTSYEEKTLFFAILILVALFAASLTIFNIYWNQYVGNDVFENKNNYSKFGKEYMAALVNLSVFVATIYAPIAALILYDNWKTQKNYELNKEILLSIDNLIFEIYNDLFKRVNCLTSLHEIEKYKIEIENYEYNKTLSNYINEFNQLQSKVELYDALNEKDLKTHLKNFGATVFKMVHISSEIYNSYNKYALKIKIRNTINTTSTTYTNVEKRMYTNEIKNLKNTMLKKHRYQSPDYTTILFLNFDEAFDQFKVEYNTITKQVRNNIKA